MCIVLYWLYYYMLLIDCTMTFFIQGAHTFSEIEIRPL